MTLGPNLLLAVALASVSFAACSRGGEAAMSTAGPKAGADASKSSTLTLRSPAFAADGTLPVRQTCDGGEASPPLQWSGVPAGTRSLALIVDDPDAPRGDWVHWVLYDLPPTTIALPEGASTGQLPSGTREGLNDWKRTGYGGACPPSGKHRYVHTLYALDAELPDLGKPDKARLQQAMEGHVLATAKLVGTYQRKH